MFLRYNLISSLLLSSFILEWIDLVNALLKGFHWLPDSLMSSRRLYGIWPLSPLALLWLCWSSGCSLNALGSKFVPVSWPLNLLSPLPGIQCPQIFTGGLLIMKVSTWMSPSQRGLACLPYLIIPTIPILYLPFS